MRRPLELELDTGFSRLLNSISSRPNKRQGPGACDLIECPMCTSGALSVDVADRENAWMIVLQSRAAA